MLIQTTWMQQKLAHVPVPGMDALFLTVLLISKRVSGRSRIVLLYQTFSFNFYTKSRHINIDYSICQAMKYNTEGMEYVLLIYDICCQWCQNFLQRVANSPFLSLPDSMKIIPAVGKFHLGAHIRSCFPLFSLN